MPRRRNRGAKKSKKGFSRKRRMNQRYGRGDEVKMSRETRIAPRVQPDRLRVTLTYPYFGVLTSSGNSFVSRRWTPNSPYDIDPVLGSTSMPGYSEWSAFYNFVVVLRYRYRIRVTNGESFPIMVYVINTNVDPTTSGTYYLDYSTQRYGKRAILSAKGGMDKFTFQGSVEISQLVGQDITKDSFYKATTTNNPSDLIYLGLGINAGTNDFTTAGISYDLELLVECHFFGRKVLTS